MARREPIRKRALRGRPAGGFTLIEVLIALAIFAMAAIVLASTYLNILSAYARAGKGSDEDPYVAVARQELLTQTDEATAEAGDGFDTPQQMAGPGVPAMPSEHVQWTADVENTAVANLFTVTFTCVVTPVGGSPTTYTETFNLLRPTWDQADASSERQAVRPQILVLQGLQAS